MGYGLGRVPAPDSRDAAFPMRLLLDPLREVAFPRGIPPGTSHYRTGAVLNQGETGTCVEHGWTSRINDAPFMRSTGLPQFAYYKIAVGIDEFRDNDREAQATDPRQLQFGTSVRAGAKVGQQLGFIESYLWAEETEDVRAWHLTGRGGVVLGIPWKSNMFRIDSDGFINFSGTNEGGHCIASKGWSDTVRHNGRLVRAIRLKQSWGKDWGEGGFCWMSEDDLAKALADNGEACAPTEFKVKPKA